MNFKTLSLLTLSLALVSSVQAIAQNRIVTVEDYERERIDIVNSNRSIDEKIERLKKLKELADAQQELQQRLNPPKPDVQTQVIPEKELVEETKPVAKYRPPIGFDTDTVYVSEIFSVANDATAEFYVNGEPVPVDLLNARKSKELFAGKFYVIGYDSNSVTFRNRHNGKSMKRRLMSTSLIKRKVEYNNELVEEYQKRFALGSLDVELQSALENSQSPVQVAYPTAVTPTVYDSMAGK